MPATQTVYKDDTDAFVSWVVTDTDGQDVDWASPQIAIGDGAYTAANWQGTPAPSREIRLAFPSGMNLPSGTYPAVLKVPNGNDFFLGMVAVRSRT